MAQPETCRNIIVDTAPARLAAVLIMCHLISACATMSKRECQQGDWHAAGYADATAGRTANRFSKHVKACAKHGIQPIAQVYLTGHQEGTQAYCQPHNGFAQGVRNNDYRGICPTDLETGYLTQYILGLQTARRDLNHAFFQYEFSLDSARFRRARLDDDQGTERIDRRIHGLENKLDTLRTARHSINSKITRWRSRVSAQLKDKTLD